MPKGYQYKESSETNKAYLLAQKAYLVVDVGGSRTISEAPKSAKKRLRRLFTAKFYHFFAVK